MRLINSVVLFPQGGKRLPPAVALFNSSRKTRLSPSAVRSPRPEKQYQGSAQR